MSVAIVFATAGHVQAGTITVGFDELSPIDTVEGFYNGGTSGLGATGPDLGIQFDGFLALNGAFGQTSPPNFAVGDFGGGVMLIDTDFGFSEFSFTSGAFTTATVEVFSGLGGTGVLLGSLVGIQGNPNAFGAFSVPQSGVGRSVVISDFGTERLDFGIDDVTFNQVPEPASLAIFGTICLVACGRRRKS